MSDQIIQLNQEPIHTELKDLVKNSVEETLNALSQHAVSALDGAFRRKHQCRIIIIKERRIVPPTGRYQTVHLPSRQRQVLRSLDGR